MERLYTRQFANFNPLPRKEGDAELIGSLTIHLMISIHSLVKRETFIVPYIHMKIKFQSTPS